MWVFFFFLQQPYAIILILQMRQLRPREGSILVKVTKLMGELPSEPRMHGPRSCALNSDSWSGFCSQIAWGLVIGISLKHMQRYVVCACKRCRLGML